MTATKPGKDADGSYLTNVYSLCSFRARRDPFLGRLPGGPATAEGVRMSRRRLARHRQQARRTTHIYHPVHGDCPWFTSQDVAERHAREWGGVAIPLRMAFDPRKAPANVIDLWPALKERAMRHG